MIEMLMLTVDVHDARHNTRFMLRLAELEINRGWIDGCWNIEDELGWITKRLDCWTMAC